MSEKNKNPYYQQRHKIRMIYDWNPLVDIIYFDDMGILSIDFERSMMPYSYVVLPQEEKKKEE